MEQSTTYLFGPFRLDTCTQLLCTEESRVSLSPKVYRLLLYFLLNSGRLISHEELFNTVWDGRIVDDSALRLAVNSLRNVLHDESKSPSYIATVNKRGYRFLAEVSMDDRYQIVQASEVSLLTYDHHLHAQKSSVWFEYTQELAELREAFHLANNGNRRLVFLHGEQGIGKTTLLDAFLDNVHHPKLTILRARCVPMGAVTEPFLPLLEALERRCREPYGRSLIERLGHLAPSWLYQMLNVLEPDEIAMLLTKTLYINTGRMMREGANFFETLCKNTTLILILDNSHWSDEFTLDLLCFLMFRCSAAKLLIIVSYRSCEDGAGIRRINEMRAELLHRGLCQELSMQKR